MAKKQYSRNGADISMGATGSFVVTPTDAPFPGGDIIRLVTINAPGTIRWLDQNGVQQDTAILPAGSYTMFATAIYSTGTSAAGITGWY